MNFENTGTKKKVIYVFMLIWFAGLITSRILIDSGVIESTELTQRAWWTSLLILGAMVTGLLFQPLIKWSFPTKNDLRVAENPELHLEDHEVLMGYYWFVSIIVLASSLLIAPLLYHEQILFQVRSMHFWWAVLGTGILNVFIFYFANKALRYGDMSLVAATHGFTLVIAFPISLGIFYLLREHAPISNPNISLVGTLGILFIISGIIAIGLQKKNNDTKPSAPIHDWFANHPIISGLTGAAIAGFAVNFDKVAVDSSNPFLMGTAVTFIVGTLALFWTLYSKGWSRVVFVYKNYWKRFIAVGIVYGAVIIIMNVALFGSNINYYAAIKRSSILFATLYGIFVLKEGINRRQKIVRASVSLLIIAGVVLITLGG